MIGARDGTLFVAFRCIIAADWVSQNRNTRALAADRNLFDYEGQRKAPDDEAKIIFIGDAGTHGPRSSRPKVSGDIE